MEVRYDMLFQIICDWVVLIGAVVIAITNILKFFGKPISFFKKKRDKEMKESLEKILNDILPKQFESHDLKTRDKYLNDRLRYLHEIKAEILKDIQGTLEEIRTLNIEQSKKLEYLNASSKDILRQKIMTIYRDYKNIRQFPIYKKEALDELYKDYKKQDGNSYIDKYYNRMKTWKVIEENQEED